MKKLFVVISLFSLFFLTACGQVENKNTEESIITENESSYSFMGKPTVFLWGSVSCPHCRDAMPIFEKDIYGTYEDKINVLLNNVGSVRFDTKIKQDMSKKYKFNNFSETECNYIPSWIIFNKEGSVVAQSCGGEKSIEDVIAVLDNMLYTNRN